MNRNPWSRMRQWLLGGGVCLGMTLAGMGWVWGQEAPPPAPDAKAGSDEAAKGTKEGAKGASDAKTEDAKGASDAAPGTDPFERPRDGADKGAGRDAADDAGKGARDTARDAAKGAREPGRQPREGGREAAEGAREPSRGERDLPGRGREDLREPAGGRDARDDAPDAAREPREPRGRDDRPDADRPPRDDLRDSRDDLRGARDSFRDDRPDPREGARDPRDSFRDSREGAQDSFRDSRDRTREFDRDLRDDARREEFSRDSRDSFRETDRDLRSETRSSRDSFRSSSRSELSIRAEDIRAPDIGLWFGRSTGDGLVISDIATTGALASTISRIGFREGDRILSVDGYRVARESDFTRYLFADEVLYEEVPVVVWRDGRRVTLYVEPITLIEQMHTVQYDPLEEVGIVLDDRYTDRVVVWRVLPRTPAFYAGIQPGDVITTFRGQRITSPQAFTQIVQRVEPGEVALEVSRNQRVRQIDLEWPQFEARMGARAALRPEIDDPAIERMSERREERLESRRLPGDDSGLEVAPPIYAPRPAVGPVRRALFPRARAR